MAKSETRPDACSERERAWPCATCGAVGLAEGYLRCIEETGHGDCAHDVTTTPCPNDALFEETD